MRRPLGAAVFTTALATLLSASEAPASDGERSGGERSNDGMHVSGALLAGAGWNDHYGAGIGGRVGVQFPLVGSAPTLGVYGGLGLVYHSDQNEPPAGSSTLEGWLVELTAEAGAHVQLPLVVLQPYVGGGLVRTSETVCDSAGCEQDDAAHPLVTPGVLLISSPTAPWAPVFVGADGRFVVASRSELNAFTLLGTIGVAL